MDTASALNNTPPVKPLPNSSVFNDTPPIPPTPPLIPNSPVDPPVIIPEFEILRYNFPLSLFGRTCNLREYPVKLIGIPSSS